MCFVYVLVSCFNNNRKHIFMPPPPPPNGFGCCPFLSGGSVVVDSWFIVASFFVGCDAVLNVLSFFAIISLRKSELSVLLLLSPQFHVIVSVLCLFLTLRRDGLQCITVASSGIQVYFSAFATFSLNQLYFEVYFYFMSIFYQNCVPKK